MIPNDCKTKTKILLPKSSLRPKAVKEYKQRQVEPQS